MCMLQTLFLWPLPPTASRASHLAASTAGECKGSTLSLAAYREDLALDPENHKFLQSLKLKEYVQVF